MRLPESMFVTDKINYSVSGQLYTSGGFADIKQGQYGECTVAVKILRVTVADDFEKIRKVSGRDVSPVVQNTAETRFPAIL